MYWFCIEHSEQHGFVLLEIFVYPSNKRKIYEPKHDFRDSKIVYSVICSYKKEIFWVYSFSEQVVAKGIPLRLFDKYSHVFICISLK